MRSAWIVCAAFSLFGCATPPPPAPPPQPPAPVAAPVPFTTPPPAKPKDTCGAEAPQGLIGKSRTEIPVIADLSRRRVVCSTCPVALDFQPDRQTILFDARTGIVTEVKCG